jgi:hypothetical protein
MNYWVAEMTGMAVTDSLFDYFEVSVICIVHIDAWFH